MRQLELAKTILSKRDPAAGCCINAAEAIAMYQGAKTTFPNGMISRLLAVNGAPCQSPIHLSAVSPDKCNIRIRSDCDVYRICARAENSFPVASTL